MKRFCIAGMLLVMGCTSFASEPKGMLLHIYCVNFMREFVSEGRLSLVLEAFAYVVYEGKKFTMTHVDGDGFMTHFEDNDTIKEVLKKAIKKWNESFSCMPGKVIYDPNAQSHEDAYTAQSFASLGHVGS